MTDKYQALREMSDDEFMASLFEVAFNQEPAEPVEFVVTVPAEQVPAEVKYRVGYKDGLYDYQEGRGYRGDTYDRAYDLGYADAYNRTYKTADDGVEAQGPMLENL